MTYTNLRKWRVAMIIIKNGYLINPVNNQEGYGDILLENERILAISMKSKKSEKGVEVAQWEENFPIEQVIDATGCKIAPGLVDVHVHFRDPGFTHKEDMNTGAKSAAKGGYTSIVLMANTKPVVDSVETLVYILEKGRETGIHIYSCSTITKGLQGKELAPLEELKKAGAVGITDDGIPLMDESVLQLAMKQAARLGLPISLHEEDASLITTNGINQEIAQEYLGTNGSPREAESNLVARDLAIAIETDVVLNIQHISTKEAVEHVRMAKKKCVDNNKYSCSIYAESTPHHFSLTQEAIKKHGTFAKMNPPLRLEEDRLAIIKGLQDNTIDLIATDHAPHTMEEKAVSFEKAPSGIIGLETALSLGITYLVKPGYLTMMQLIEKMSVNPSNLYGLEAGVIQEGKSADLIIFREDETWTVGEFWSKSNNSPFCGELLNGVIQYTICKGRIVYEKE